MKILYRISNNSYSKLKLSHATKEYCLNNFLVRFNNIHNEIIIIADNVTDIKLKEYLKTLNSVTITYTQLNNAQSFKFAYETALQFNDDEFIYFVEDDYLHRYKSNDILVEGVQLADYVTLYDHPDKYINSINGGNPFVEDGGELTRVITSKSSHWKLTNSTTMTFASNVKTLKADYDIWKQYLTGSHPNDFQAFLQLRSKGKSLISSIPGMATHCEIAWLSPFMNWNEV